VSDRATPPAADMAGARPNGRRARTSPSRDGEEGPASFGTVASEGAVPAAAEPAAPLSRGG
jgi:hypothetical protein